MNKIEIGNLVISKAGRDCGELYMVYSIQGENIILVNGQAKKLNHPKIKNSKHVIVTNLLLSAIKEKIANKKKIFDSEIYSAIKKCAEALDKNI
ncbi:MAG: KOW domain-containing RNA-binding protein [Clostridia bacterium]|jgi:ribosomal protein L14E/L6E/L27E